MQQRRAFIKQLGIVLNGMFMPVTLLNRLTNELMKQEKQFDVIIVGGSYSGLAAGMALGRALRNVLIIDAGDPCNKQTPFSHNFLTNDGKTPKEIANLAKQQVRAYGSISFVEGMAIVGTKTGNGFAVQMQTGELFKARKLIFATGIKDIMPDIPGLSESWGISVLHCPYCHGYEVRHQKTGIIANGEDGYELSSLISNWTTDLTLFTNGKATLSEDQRNKLNQHNISIVETEIDRLDNKNGHLQNVILKDRSRAQIKAIYARLPFVQHSSIPHTLGCELTKEGYIKIDPAQKTSIPGVFACGDNTTRMRTVANAVSMGTTTGLMVNKELIEEDF